MTHVEPQIGVSFVERLNQAFADGDNGYQSKAAEAGQVELLRAVFTDLIEGRPAKFAAHLADDVELEICGFPVWDGVTKGREAVLAAMGRNFAMLAEQRPEIVNLVAQGDQVALRLREKGRFATTGAAYSAQVIQWFTFRNGRIARIYELVSVTSYPPAGGRG